MIVILTIQPCLIEAACSRPAALADFVFDDFKNQIIVKGLHSRPSHSIRLPSKRQKLRYTAFSRLRLIPRTLRIQAGNSPVTDKHRADFGVTAFRWGRHFEIEDADAPALLAIVRSAVA